MDPSFSPSVPLACLVDLVACKPIPNDLILPEAQNVARPWLHDTMHGFFTQARRFMRVTRRGTALFTMPRRSHKVEIVKRYIGDATPPEVSLAPEDEEDEEVVGSLQLQDACALLPVYDLETGDPFLNMAVLARWNRAPDNNSKIVGDGTVPIITLAMPAVELERLALLVLSFGEHATSRLVYAYRDAKPIHMRTVKTAEPKEEPEIGALPSKSAITPVQLQIEPFGFTEMDSDEEDLAAVLFGTSAKATHDDDVAVVEDEPEEEEVDTDDEEFKAALGIPPSVSSKKSSTLVPLVKAPSVVASSLESGASVTSATKLINPFHFGIGTLPPREARHHEDGSFTLALAHREATLMTVDAITTFYEDEDVKRIEERRVETQFVRHTLAAARKGALMVQALGREAPVLINDHVTTRAVQKPKGTIHAVTNLAVRVGGSAYISGIAAARPTAVSNPLGQRSAW